MVTADHGLHRSRRADSGPGVVPRVWPQDAIRESVDGVDARGVFRIPSCWVRFWLHHTGRAVKAQWPARAAAESFGLDPFLDSEVGCFRGTDAGLNGGTHVNAVSRGGRRDIDPGWLGALTVRWCGSPAGRRTGRGRCVLTCVPS